MLPEKWGCFLQLTCLHPSTAQQSLVGQAWNHFLSPKVSTTLPAVGFLFKHKRLVANSLAIENWVYEFCYFPFLWTSFLPKKRKKISRKAGPVLEIALQIYDSQSSLPAVKGCLPWKQSEYIYFEASYEKIKSIWICCVSPWIWSDVPSQQNSLTKQKLNETLPCDSK